jgi:hypothetical protein
MSDIRTRVERVHLVALPMDDLQENAAIVNAHQRPASGQRPERLFERHRAHRGGDRHIGPAEALDGGRGAAPDPLWHLIDYTRCITASAMTASLFGVYQTAVKP